MKPVRAYILEFDPLTTVGLGAAAHVGLNALTKAAAEHPEGRKKFAQAKRKAKLEK